MVEVEAELAQVLGEVLEADGALVRADEPALQVRCDPAYSRHEGVRAGQAVVEEGHLVDVTKLFQPGVAGPVGSADKTTGFYRGPYEVDQAERGLAGDVPEANAADALPILFGCHRDNCVGFGSKCVDAVLEPSQVCFINLDRPLEPFEARSKHGLTEAIEPRPGRYVAP